jgi:triacylglycerol lipase
VIALSLMVAGCGAGCGAESNAQVCERAGEHVSQCLGGAPVAYEPAECDPETSADILQQDCSALQGDRADGWVKSTLCRLGFADYCEFPALLAEPEGAPARYPIVFVHGFAASPDFNGFGPSIIAGLRGDGHVVYDAELPPFAPVAVRTNHLARRVKAVLDETGAAKVHLIAHSMGGLDSRYLVCNGVTEDGSDLTGLDIDFGRYIATITTVSTPHRGTWAADLMLDINPPAELLNAMALVFGDLVSDVAGSPDVRGALVDLSEEGTVAFNAACPEDPDVRYFSYAGVSSVLGINAQEDRERQICETSLRHPGTAAKTHVLLDVTAGVAAHGLELRPNDGLVTVESAKWGEFLGCIPADHGHEVAALGQDRFVGRTGFDINLFYRHHALSLATLE